MGSSIQRALVCALVGLAAGAALRAQAATHYVSPSGGQVSPYTTWSTAARVIQDAVDAASDGDEIVVTNGTYSTGGRAAGTNLFLNRVAADKILTLRSVNGPQFTLIDGLKTVRCVSLASNASMFGFTLTNGLVGSVGGGVSCDDPGTIVSNCVISGNVAASNNFGGGAYGGTLYNCTLTGNSAAGGGGACNGLLYNCIISGNSASQGGGAYGGTLNNCAVTKNSAESGGGVYTGTLRNCTVTGNSGAFGAGVAGADLRNCIVYYNIGPGGNSDLNSTLSYCCTTPVPSAGSNNVSIEPGLAGNWHLAASSPCIGKGSYDSASGVDLDNEPWANPPAIGCDQFLAGSLAGALNVACSIPCTNLAVGFSLALESVITGKAASSAWDFGDGTVVSNQPYVSHAWAAAGNYPIVLRAYNNSFPGGVAATAMVYVVTQPVHYVVTNGSSRMAPYSSWATAATNIQDAVDASTVAGALVLVSNGVYQTGMRAVYGISNRVAVTKPVTVRSVNGPAVTRIVGNRVALFVYGSAAMRCVYLTNGATLSGFTLTNGTTQASGDPTKQQSGGGVYCEFGNTLVSNCVLMGNAAANRGGGACFGTLLNCTLTNNNSTYGGGAWSSSLSNCTLVANNASSGGGAYNCALMKCFLRTNYASYGGGTYVGIVEACTLTNNVAASGGGAYASVINNSALMGNSASAYSPYGGAAYNCTLNNCTLTANSASGSFPYAGGAYLGIANNCIIYFNSASNGPNYYFPGQNFLNYCCTTPSPGGLGNITATPLLQNYAAGNLHLQAGSPCINAGNNALSAGSTDLDGNSRLMNGTVDMGAYEFQGPGSVIAYSWLQQYGLATDGSADYLDPDHDGMNNWQEWMAGTDPTNTLSTFQITAATATANNVTAPVIIWPSQTTRRYYIQRSANLIPLVFSTIQDNIAGQPGTTSYTDTEAPGPGPWFYRIGIIGQ